MPASSFKNPPVVKLPVSKLQLDLKCIEHDKLVETDIARFSSYRHHVLELTQRQEKGAGVGVLF